MNDLHSSNYFMYASGLCTKEKENYISTIYDPYSGCIYGLIADILHDPAIVEETFAEVINYLAGQFGEYDARRFSLLNWVMNTTRMIALKNFYALRYQAVDCTPFTKLQILETAITHMHYSDGLSGHSISDKLRLPLAYVQLLLKSDSNIEGAQSKRNTT